MSEHQQPQDQLAKVLVEYCLEQIREGRGDSSFLQLCRQVVADSGGEYLQSISTSLKLANALPPKPDLKKIV